MSFQNVEATSTVGPIDHSFMNQAPGAAPADMTSPDIPDATPPEEPANAAPGVPDAALLDEVIPLSERRSVDRRRQPPMAVYSAFLAERPSKDDALRMLVAMLAWPLGIRGALLLSHSKSAPAEMGSCLEQLEGLSDARERAIWMGALKLRLANADERRFQIWDDAPPPETASMACGFLGTTTNPIGYIILIGAQPLQIRTLQQFAGPLLDLLSLYMVGAVPSDRQLDPRGGSAGGNGLHLSARQHQVLYLLSQNLTMRQIASRIGYSDSTVRMDSLAIYRALGVHDRDGAVSAAIAHGLMPEAS